MLIILFIFRIFSLSLSLSLSLSFSLSLSKKTNKKENKQTNKRVTIWARFPQQPGQHGHVVVVGVGPARVRRVAGLGRRWTLVIGLKQFLAAILNFPDETGSRFFVIISFLSLLLNLKICH